MDSRGTHRIGIGGIDKDLPQGGVAQVRAEAARAKTVSGPDVVRQALIGDEAVNIGDRLDLGFVIGLVVVGSGLRRIDDIRKHVVIDNDGRRIQIVLLHDHVFLGRGLGRAIHGAVCIEIELRRERLVLLTAKVHHAVRIAEIAGQHIPQKLLGRVGRIDAERLQHIGAQPSIIDEIIDCLHVSDLRAVIVGVLDRLLFLIGEGCVVPVRSGRLPAHPSAHRARVH